MTTDIVDINAWRRITDKAKAKIKVKASEHVRKQAMKVFEYVLKQTPQQTGTLVSNWHLVVGASNVRGFSAPLSDSAAWPDGKSPYIGWSKDSSGKWIADKSGYQAPFHAGMTESMVGPRSQAQAKLPVIKWNSKIAIINTAPYAGSLAEGTATMGKGQELEYRDPNVAHTDPGVLFGPFWNIKTATITKFNYLKGI